METIDYTAQTVPLVNRVKRTHSMSYLCNAFGAPASRKWRQLFVFTFISGVLMMGAAHAQSAFGWLEFKPVPKRNLIQITGHALALEAVSGMDFTLSLSRKNGGNTSNTRQSGRFDLAANEPKVLSTTSLNVEPGDEHNDRVQNRGSWQGGFERDRLHEACRQRTIALIRVHPRMHRRWRRCSRQSCSRCPHANGDGRQQSRRGR